MGGSAGGMSIPGLEIPGIGAPGSGDGGDGDGEAGNADGNCDGGFGLPGGMGQSGDCEGAAGEGGGAGGAGGVGEYPGESDAQRAERLGKELEESVGDFDEVLMEEQREISTVSRNTQGFGSGSGAAGGPGGSVGLGGQQGSGSGAPGGSVSILNPTEKRTSTVDGMTDDEKQARLPDDIVENVGDDIVARQLYEAALAEDDPVLRERLWEEYRKYNGL